MNKIWHAGDPDAVSWFTHNSNFANEHEFVSSVIPDAGSADFLNLPERIKNILRLDKPDLIITLDIHKVDEPVISLEITMTTPQSQHAKQRIPRIIAAAESNIPAIYLIPKRKLSGGSLYKIGSDVYFCLDKVQKMNRVPVIIYNWPDIEGTLITDNEFPNLPNINNEEMTDMFQTMDKMLELRLSSEHSEQFKQNLYEDGWIKSQIKKTTDMGNEWDGDMGNFSTLELIKTEDLSNYLQNNTRMNNRRITRTLDRLPQRILNRVNTLIFKPTGRMFDHAGDPYTGMISFFDYVYCRYGRNVEERHTNLVYMPLKDGSKNIIDEFAPAGYNRFYENNCPLSVDTVPTLEQQFSISHHLQYGCVFTKKKPLRIYGYFSDMIFFQDSMLVF